MEREEEQEPPPGPGRTIMFYPRELVDVVLAASDAPTPGASQAPAGPPVPQVPALDNTYGALFIGAAFGFMCVFIHFSRLLAN